MEYINQPLFNNSQTPPQIVAFHENIPSLLQVILLLVYKYFTLDHL